MGLRNCKLGLGDASQLCPDTLLDCTGWAGGTDRRLGDLAKAGEDANR